MQQRLNEHVSILIFSRILAYTVCMDLELKLSKLDQFVTCFWNLNLAVKSHSFEMKVKQVLK